MHHKKEIAMNTQSQKQPVIPLGKRFADFSSTAEIYKHVFKTPNSLRHYVFYAKQNGLDQVISRLGKKLVFDLDKLDQWLATGGAL